MREDFTLLFCIVAGLAVLLGRGAQPPDLMRSYGAYQSALERGDNRRAARYGEQMIEAAKSSDLFDEAGLARLEIMVGEAQADAGNPQRARVLYQLALSVLDDGDHPAELGAAKEKLGALERIIADRSLRGTIALSPGG
jgi:hypothetical protein